MHRYFGAAIATLKLFQHPENAKFQFFHLPIPAEMLYLQNYLTNFLKLFLAEARGRCLLLLKISTAQIFSFSNTNVTTFPTSRKCKYFNFAFHTVPAEMLYLQKYLTNFLKLFFGWKKRNLAIVVENLRYTDILVLQMQRYNFSNIQKM